MTLLATRWLLVATSRGSVHSRPFLLGSHNGFHLSASRTLPITQSLIYGSKSGHSKFSIVTATMQEPGSLQNSVHLHKCPVTFSTLSRCYSNNPEELSTLRRGWIKLAGLIKAFMEGTKALYRDVKYMYELQKRSGSLVVSQDAPREVAPGKIDFPFTQKEVQFIYQTKRDLVKMLPIVVVFFIPVIGYAVPVVVFMYPHKLLSQHFWTAEQRQEFRMKTASLRKEHLRSLASLVMERGTAEQRQCLASVSHKVGNEDGEPDWEEFREQFDLRKISKTHLESLLASWGLTSKLPLPKPYHRRQLERHLHYVFLGDWLIHGGGGVEGMSQEDIEKACEERGLVVKGSEGRKAALESWVHLSTGYRDCPVELLAHYPLLELMDDE